MAFCINCGQELAEGAKFCSKCGAMNGLTSHMEEKTGMQTEYPAEDTSVYSERKQEFAGKIIKCPSCGTELSSFSAICPDCGHEINSRKVSPYIRDFSKSIDELDQIIANDPEPPKTGWRVWGKKKRIFWVVLNVLAFCIPLVIYLTWPLIKPFLFPNRTPVLSSAEKRKAALIQNFTFPNERESIIEALLFVNSKIAFLLSEKYNKKTLFWLKLWNTKATQLHQKANILLSNDTIAEAAYSDIIASKKTIDKKIRIRAGVGLAVIAIYIILVIVVCSLLKGIPNLLPDNSGLKNVRIGEEFEWIESGLGTHIPAIEANKGTYSTNSDTELSVSVKKLTYSQFEKYISDCKNVGYMVDASKDTNRYTAYNEKGYYLELQYHSRNKELDIMLKAPLIWPAQDIGNMIPIIANKSGEILTADDEELTIKIYGVTDSWLENYIAECKNVGYTIEVSRDVGEYAAYNAEGYYLELQKIFDYSYIKLKSPLMWPVHNLTSVIPEIAGKSGKIETSTDEKLAISIYGVTVNEFVTYMEECENKGFTIDSEKNENTFSSFNSAGYKLTITLEDTKKLSIVVDAPMVLSNITWPSSGPATLIPEPSFDEGKITSDYDWAFTVYLREMTIEEFNDYVDECIDNGFEKDYRSEHYFSADKGEDISLRIEYLGNNTVVIRIDDLSKLGN